MSACFLFIGTPEFVELQQTNFEEWNLRAGAYDLVISAQAFHCVNREIGYIKAAQALKENGYIALFWNFSPVPDYMTVTLHKLVLARHFVLFILVLIFTKRHPNTTRLTYVET
jgi:cyclopropane fatty-acyl-phospholipid synthase-like methyltransferase